MGRRNIIQPYKVFAAGDISGNLTQASPYTTIDQVDKVGIELEWTGTAPVGEFFVDVAFLYPNTTDFSQWQTLDFGSSIAITGNTGSHLISIQDPPFQKMRLRYVRTSGTGTLTATLFASNKGA